MRNIKLILMYDGNAYAGWQRLSNKENSNKSIQYILEKSIEQVIGEQVKIIGSGRTDAGVHAYHQVANFHTKQNIELAYFKQVLNDLLPEDIKIVQLEVVPDSFHSRYSATKKTYEYLIDRNERASVFYRKYTYPLEKQLNISAMKSAASYFIGSHDFKGFSTERKNIKSTVRTIYDINILEEERKSGSIIKIRITGNGFLYHMVRIMVGTLIEVGLNERSPMSIKDILSTGIRKDAGIMLSPQGLYLANVEYR